MKKLLSATVLFFCISYLSFGHVTNVYAVPYLYVSAYNEASVRLFDGTTGESLGKFIDGSSPDDELQHPMGLAFGDDGNLYVANYEGDNNILRYNGITGEFIDVFASGNGLNNPRGIIFGPDGNLYVSTDNSVCRFDGLTGDFIDNFASHQNLHVAGALIFGPDANLYVNGIYSDNVVRFNGITGEYIDVVAEGHGLDYPRGLAFGPDDNLYVSNTNGDNILRYNVTTATFIDIFSDSTELNHPTALYFETGGNMYVASQHTTYDTVMQFDSGTGEFIERFASVPGVPNSGFGYFIFHDSAIPEPTTIFFLCLSLIGLRLKKQN